MYIPNTYPTTLAEMLSFLLPSVQDGLFDSVSYDDDDSPTKIVCTQNGNVILEITVNESSQFTFTPYIAEGSAADVAHSAFFKIDEAFRCSGGIYFRSNAQGSPIYYYRFAIAKTRTGKTAFVHCFNYNVESSAYCQLFISSFGDNPELPMYNGFLIAVNLGSVYDRTILSQLPVIGGRGSTDCFSTLLLRTAAQIIETSEQIIGGTKYGCADIFAILDT